jgi:hypothetical protein
VGVTAVEVVQLTAAVVGMVMSGWSYYMAIQRYRELLTAGTNGMSGYAARVRKRREGTRLLKHTLMLFGGWVALQWRMELDYDLPMFAVYSRNVTLTLVSCLITKETIADYYDQKHLQEMDEAEYQRGLRGGRRVTDPKDAA